MVAELQSPHMNEGFGRGSGLGRDPGGSGSR